MSSVSCDHLEESTRNLIECLPKAELHLHLEGSVPPDIAKSLAEEQDIDLPWLPSASGEQPERSLSLPDFRSFIPLYLAISSCLNRPEHFERAVAGVARELKKNNVQYAEVTVTPGTHLTRGVSEDTILTGLQAGRARAQSEFGIDLRWVFDVVRTLPEQGEMTVQIALRGKSEGVVGIGLGGLERDSENLEGLVPVFEAAVAGGLVSLPHAGEQAGPDNIRFAIERLLATRVGHGIRALEDDGVVELIRERGVTLEVCPTSNLALGYVSSLASHPLRELLARGIDCCLATDDAAIFASTLNDEYRRAASSMKLSASQVVKLVRHSFEASMLDTQTKRARIQEVESLAQSVLSRGTV